MTLKLTHELAAAVDASGQEVVEVIHPTTNRMYFIVDGETHQQAMAALHKQRLRGDHAAIAEGITQMEAGEGIQLEEAREQSRQRLLARRQ